MIKFTGVREGKEFVGIGLSRGNCEKLLEGKPIVVDLRKIGSHDAAELFIMGGETEVAMHDELQKLGVLDGAEVRISSWVDRADQIPGVQREG